MIFKPEEMIGVIDLRLLGYYKIKQGCYKRTSVGITNLKEQRDFVNILTNL